MKKDIKLLRGRVAFGVITIREDEAEAVLNRFEALDTARGRADYDVGVVRTLDGSEHQFALIRCPSTGQGTAQRTAHDLIEDLAPSLILLVGIGGAVPSKDFTLGDVVCATRVHDFCVVAALENRPNELDSRGGPMHRRIEALLGRLPAIVRKAPLKGWNSHASIGPALPSISAPPEGSDRYYGSDNWQKDVRESLEYHFPTGIEHRSRLVTARPIASSDALVKDTDIVQHWRNAARAVAAVEMELAGIYIAARGDPEVPILAVRGISDIVGFKRGEEWTKFACDSAAAFAHAFVKSGELDHLFPSVAASLSKPLEQPGSPVVERHPGLQSQQIDPKRAHHALDRKIFISYSHDSPKHSERIRALAGQLKADGLQVTIDQFANDPDEGWPAWSEGQLRSADIVLVAISATYVRRYYGHEASGSGRGATFEAWIIRQQLYEAQGRNSKYRVILFEDSDEKFVPDTLKGNNLYRPADPNGYQELLNWLRGTIKAEAPRDREPTIVWPQPADEFLSELADRKPEFGHFKQVLAGKTPQRILLLRGPTNCGKTALLRVLRAYCDHVQVPVGYANLKGCPPIDDVLQAVHFDVGQHLPRSFQGAGGQGRTWELLSDLDCLRKPLVIAFDTYEEAPEEVRKWVEGQLLPRLSRIAAVVVILCGQELPEPGKHLWRQIATLFDLPSISVPEEWVEYAYREVPDTQLKREHAEALTLAFSGNPGLISALILVLANQLKPGRLA